MNNDSFSSEVKERVKAFWNERSKTFDQDIGHGADEIECSMWKKHLGSIIGSEPKDILDVGTGTGMIALTLAEVGHRVTGIDLGEKMMEIAIQKAEERNLQVTFRLGDAENPEFPDNTFDCVICRHLLWTLPHPDQAVREWSRVCRPGGVVIAIDGHAQARNYFPKPPADSSKMSDRDRLWHQTYSPDIVHHFPYRENLTTDTISALFSSENLYDVKSMQIEEISRYQQSLQKDEGHKDHGEVNVIWGTVSR